MRGMSLAHLPWPVGAAGVVLLLCVWALGKWLTTRWLLRRDEEYLRQLAQLGVVLEAESKAKDAAVRRFDEQFARIEGILGERDSWQRLYQDQSSEHGTAQAMMMSERAQLVTQLQRAGVKPKVDRTIEAVARHFQETHVAAAAVPVGQHGDGTEVEGDGGSKRA